MIQMLCLFLSWSANAGGETYVGKLQSELPATVRHETGEVVGDHHALEVRRIDADLIVFFEREERFPEKSPKPEWRITDSMEYPAKGAKENLVANECRRGNRNPDPEIMAVVQVAGPAVARLRAKKAWRMNRQTGKFEKISATGVTCVNEIESDAD